MVAKNSPQFELRCPKCNSTLVHTRIKTKDRACRKCGHIGAYKEFEVNPKGKKR